MKTIAILAATPKGGIGLNGNLLLKIPQDMRFFKTESKRTTDPTKRNAVIMGRRTAASLPASGLPGRLLLVLSSSPLPCVGNADVTSATSLSQAIALIKEQHACSVENIIIAGGAAVYNEVFEKGIADEILWTRINRDLEADTFVILPTSTYQVVGASGTDVCDGVPFDFVKYRKTGGVPVRFREWEEVAGRGRHEELQYLSLIAEVIEAGNVKGDRTGTGTLSVFGRQMRYDLRNSFPLLTTKRVFWRGIAEELLWFIRGDTNGKNLADKGIKIWEGNGSREFLDGRGLGDREVGDLGPIYGFQWRHFGAEYKDMHADYSGQGVDQLAEVIRTIKTNPNDRRIIMTAWNPTALPEMALPPCHMFCQFYVNDGHLSCQMYQRSADLGLGVPFNIASYALLTCIIAQVCGLQRGDFVHTLGDAHVYSNHVEPLKEQLLRVPRPLPVLKINPSIQDIDKFTINDFTIIDYQPHPKLAMQMAV